MSEDKRPEHWTREDIEAAGWEIDAYGLIRTPGKFSGEPFWTPAADEMAGDGSYGETFELDGYQVTVMEVDAATRKAWELDRTTTHVRIGVSSEGLVSAGEMEPMEAAEAIGAAEEAYADGDDDEEA